MGYISAKINNFTAPVPLIETIFLVRFRPIHLDNILLPSPICENKYDRIDTMASGKNQQI